SDWWWRSRKAPPASHPRAGLEPTTFLPGLEPGRAGNVSWRGPRIFGGKELKLGGGGQGRLGRRGPGRRQRGVGDGVRGPIQGLGDADGKVKGDPLIRFSVGRQAGERAGIGVARD